MKFIRWLKDVRDINKCRDIIWSELDRNRDDDIRLLYLTSILANALYRARREYGTRAAKKL